MEDTHKLIPLLVVCGPTASGKTRLATDLARRFGGEVVGADSMQVYRGMDIGTAKPTTEETGGVPHHLIDFLPPDREFSVADYVKLAREVIEDIAGRGKLPVLAGGTGLYISALIDNLVFDGMPEDKGVRAELESLCAEEGPHRLWELLYEVDPELAEKLHPHNRGRVLRALEVYRLTGVPMSRWQREARREPPFCRPCLLGLRFAEREELYRRIDARVDRMLAAGLVEEARSLLGGGCSKTALQAIGYKELAPCLRGEMGLGEAAANIKMQTRRYAKRQMTWLRRDQRIHWLEVDSYPCYGALLAAACRIAGEGLGICEKE